MKLSYDAEVDALYIRLIEGPCECRTLRLNDEIALNIGGGETLVGVEILDASRVLGWSSGPRVALENVTAAQRRRPGGRKKAHPVSRGCRG